jgi:hypothetical protein
MHLSEGRSYPPILRTAALRQIQSFRLIALFGLVQFASQNLRTRTSDVCMIEDLY